MKRNEKHQQQMLTLPLPAQTNDDNVMDITDGFAGDNIGITLGGICSPVNGCFVSFFSKAISLVLLIYETNCTFASHFPLALSMIGFV